KTVLERKAPPTFDVLVEQSSWREVTVHPDVASAVDELLRGRVPSVEQRTRDDQEHVSMRIVATQPVETPAWGGAGDLERDLFDRGGRRRGRSSEWARDSRQARLLDDPRHLRAQEAYWDEEDADEALDVEAAEPTGTTGWVDTPSRGKARARRAVRIYPFGISRERLEQSARQLRVPVEISTDQDSADAVITLRTFYRRQSDRLRAAESERKPIYVLRTNTIAQMQECLAHIFDLRRGVEGVADDATPDNPALEAMREAEDAINRLLTRGGASHVDLTPANAYVRRVQHQIAERYNLASRSYGKEPHRRVKIFAR
ncbi:MAG: hypothetical protein IVW57_19875, partial [Ktedonobacterales bacterium]|nr:hypothetical protein [Ktedonobacterales bacterium]